MQELKPSKTSWKIISLLAVSVIAVGISSAQSYKFPPNGRFLIPASSGKELLKQCSRPAPDKVDEFWSPSTQDLDQLETALAEYLLKREASGRSTPPKGVYHRQYVEIIVRTGVSQKPERFIYGNFYLESVVQQAARDEGRVPVGVCDGGTAFWGIVYRVATKTFEKIEFNGFG